MRNKSIDLETLATKLDISPSMHKYAIERYYGISEYLNTNGNQAIFYPQGSFRTGTVVRPLVDGKEGDFDIDVVCELSNDKVNTTAEKIKKCVGDVLKNSELYYKKLLPEQDRCWTLEYAEVVQGIGLMMDVVPCVGEDENLINQVIEKGVDTVFAKQAIAITERVSAGKYQWQASNPKGYGEWFDNINRKFLQVGLYEKKNEIFNDNRFLFSADASIDDVPDYFVRSALQRVIQLLKRHRDLYYRRIENGSELRPISAILTTLSAKISNETSITDVEGLLSYIVYGLKEYTALMQGQTPKERFRGEIRNYIEKRDQKWWIPNPVSPDDNYADTWTDDTARAFFAWVETVAIDLSDTSVVNEMRYLTGLKTAFGMEFVDKSLSLDSARTPIKKPSTVISPTKPYKK